ncbi:MAG: ECF transporter S component [Oscillospiraceae bacterium]|nr:ECF transporter S component [Oscillospiraceae bacterium]
MTGAGVNRTRIITLTGILMAMNIVLSSFGIPVPGGHLYLNDIIICAAALILGPFPAFMVGGVGAFIGDMLFYPAPMFVSLATHGLQAVVISLISHKLFQKKQLVSDITAVSVGAVIMVVGYTLGRAYVYSTPEYAMVKLPYQILQAVVGAIFGVFLCNSLNLRKMAFKQ